VLLAVGCSGGAGTSGDVLGEIVIIPTRDIVQDPGTRDTGDTPFRDVARTDVPQELPTDPGSATDDGDLQEPLDVPIPRDVPDVLPDTGPTDLAGDAPDAPLQDLLPTDIAADQLPDPGPSDVGHDLVAGACAPGSVTCWCEDETQCDPAYGKPCRPNRCNTSTGHCVLDSGFLEGQECDDGDFCTTGETCVKGNCVGGVVGCECHTDAECPDTNPCTDDQCVQGHCQHPFNTAPCDDGDGCTNGDACADGVCVPGTRVCECDGDARCDDGIACTTDRCAAGACTHVLDAGTCLVAGTCVVAPANEPGNQCRACVPGTATDAWTNVMDGTACDDGNACTAPDTCVSGACVPGLKVCECSIAAECDDGNPCTDDTCPANACVHTANTAPCEDGDPATLGDRCVASACVPGPRCGDGTCARPTETCATCPADCGGACPVRETLCSDGWDDDLDGLTDCADPDCQGLPPCTPDTCTLVDGTVACGTTKYYLTASGDNLTGNAAAACGGDSLSGDDIIWKFVSPVTRQVTVRIDPSDFNSSDTFSLYVLSGACNPSTCIASDWGFYAEVTFTAEAGRPYYFAYEDSWSGAEADLHVTCP